MVGQDRHWKRRSACWTGFRHHLRGFLSWLDETSQTECGDGGHDDDRAGHRMGSLFWIQH